VSETKKAIVITGPSGSGKGNVVKKLLKRFDFFELSISATTREPGPGEIHGKDYYFISLDEFRKKIAEKAFLEYEEVYAGSFYGTFNEEIEKIAQRGKFPLFEIDVAGALRIKEILGDTTCVIFLHPGEPVVDILRERLWNRGRDSGDKIEKRLQKVPKEIEMGFHCDYIVVNQNGEFDNTIEVIADTIESFLSEEIKN